MSCRAREDSGASYHVTAMRDRLARCFIVWESYVVSCTHKATYQQGSR